jgi:hypothetical protein
MTGVFMLVSVAMTTAPTEGQVPLRLTGPWIGTADIFDTWVEQRTLDVAVFIRPDGSVTGMIGQAPVKNGRFHRNRGALGRFLGVKTDWIITGTLNGYLVPGEGVRATAVTIPLNWREDHFVGSVTATVPGRLGRTRITAGRLLLQRIGRSRGSSRDRN